MRRAPASRRVRAAWAVPAFLLVLAGCGGDGTTPVAGEAQSSAPAASPSSVVSEEARGGTATGGATDDAVEDRADQNLAAGRAGSWDEKTIVPAMMAAVADQKTAHVTMTTAAGGMSMDAAGDLAFRGPDQDMELVMDGAAMGVERIEIRMVDQVVYLAMPPMTPAGKFVEIKPGSDSPLAGMVGQMQGVDPRDTFRAFESGLEDVMFLGVESVDGEELEHYRLTVDIAKAQLQGMPRSGGMRRKVRYDMWLDQDALMRRAEFSLAQQVSVVMEMSDWGEPVAIKAPARKDIVQAPGQ